MEWIVWGFWIIGLVYLGVGAAVTAWPRAVLLVICESLGAFGRFLRGVLTCGPCFSFWVGLAVGLPDNAVLANLLPVWCISSLTAVAVSGHIVSGILAVGLVVVVQNWTTIPLAAPREES